MSRRYSELPFSLHHRKRYLLHNPEEVEYELHSLFSNPLLCVCLRRGVLYMLERIAFLRECYDCFRVLS